MKSLPIATRVAATILLGHHPEKVIANGNRVTFARFILKYKKGT